MSPLEMMRERRAAKNQELEELLSGPTSEKRDLSEDESTKFDTLVEEIRKADEQIEKLEATEKRNAASNAAAVVAGDVGEQRTAPATVKDPPIYAEHKSDTSYFRDLYMAQHKGDRDSTDRLVRNNKQTADEMESRALGNTGGAGGSGGEFAPPLWLIDEFVALARPGRKLVDSIGTKPLPSGVSSVNLPRVTGGTTTAIQTTQNSALSQTDMTTGSVSGTVSTIGGKQVVSLQLLQQSGIPFDEVVLQDLAADYARALSLQVLLGSNGSGQLNGIATYFTASGTVNITYTQATPAVGGTGGLYSKIFAAAAAIETARYLPPDTVWMHPRRWNWIQRGRPVPRPRLRRSDPQPVHHQRRGRQRHRPRHPGLLSRILRGK
jgi:HK97 family phage major capsid protein